MEEFIIHGDFKQAEKLVAQLPVESARRYYRAIMDFIVGDYAGSLEELTFGKFFIEQYYLDICQLKVINLFKMGKREAFLRESKICWFQLASEGYGDTVWIESLKDMMFERKSWVDPFLLENRGLESWFKAGMFLQRDDLLEKTFVRLRQTGKDPWLKELMALHHYRQGRYRKAFDAAYNIEGVNARNILGRIYMAGDDFQGAWKSFNQAIRYRGDSHNALEYLPPLAWILNHWSEGRKFLLKLGAIRKLELEEVALLAAFNIQEGRFKVAKRVLALMEKRFAKALPLEGLLMGSYISLRLKNLEAMLPYALKSCLLSEGINCWMLLQQITWKDFGGLIERNERIFAEGVPDIDQYREPVAIVPLQEKRLILSKDIEELDATGR